MMISMPRIESIWDLSCRDMSNAEIGGQRLTGHDLQASFDGRFLS